jgi:hypothetical protein
LLTEKIDHVVFLATDGDGNQLIIKVDKWEGSELDPSAPEALYATLEAHLLEEYGTDVTITEYAIASGSYKEGSGGIFLSDGSLVDQGDIDEFWFGDAWTDKKGGKFDKKEVDFDLDFDDLPDADSLQGKNELPVDGEEALKQADESVEGESVDDEGHNDDVAPFEEELVSNHFSDEQAPSDSMADIVVDNINLNYADTDGANYEIFGDAPLLILNPGEEEFEAVSAPDEAGSVEIGDLISDEDDLQGLLSDGEGDPSSFEVRNSDLESITLDEGLKLELDDGDSSDSLD